MIACCFDGVCTDGAVDSATHQSQLTALASRAAQNQSCYCESSCARQVLEALGTYPISSSDSREEFQYLVHLKHVEQNHTAISNRIVGSIFENISVKFSQEHRMPEPEHNCGQGVNSHGSYTCGS